VGSRHVPVPEKLIIYPEKAICDGAMYSPGYFPRGYFCTPTSWAGGALKALGRRYDFNPQTTPWRNLSSAAKNAFLYGDPNPEPMQLSYIGTRRGKKVEVTGKGRWLGFYKWVGDWDIGGTYTRKEPCAGCGGTGLREKFLQVTVLDKNVHDLHSLTLSQLLKTLKPLQEKIADDMISLHHLQKILRRLEFLMRVGLGYLDLGRVASTLSAGEAQRLVLSSLLGSGFTSLTILLDEPTRGMHPTEVEALVEALQGLRDEGNTVIVVEHDHDVIAAADQIVDMGPGSGSRGGRVLVSGSVDKLKRANTLTANWLVGERHPSFRETVRHPSRWLHVTGARENNLQNITVDIPTDVLVGICGVSGSGKSTLLIDTIGRAVAPKKFTTSVSFEPIEPGAHDVIEGVPERVVILDQGRKGISSPGQALDLFKPLFRLYSESEDAKALGLDEKALSKPCTACEGRGRIRIEMGFLPDVFSDCETCNGTGYSPETWNVKLQGLSLPDLNSLTLEDLYELFKSEDRIASILKTALDVGLGYLVLKQPSVTLSGGEVQRLKIAQELSKKQKKGTLFILDEPTVGQHMEDVERLAQVLHRLVDDGYGVIVIEHHPNLLASCDYLIEFGPKGGPEGGRIIATGPPKEIAELRTPTAPFIKHVLEETT
jgi:excinuclease ABC subunit A